MPRGFTLNSNEILQALEEPLQGIVSAVRQALEQTPPDLGGDVAERGIVITGGGALLRDIDKLIMKETGLAGDHRGRSALRAWRAAADVYSNSRKSTGEGISACNEAFSPGPQPFSSNVLNVQVTTGGSTPSGASWLGSKSWSLCRSHATNRSSPLRLESSLPRA